MNETILSKEAKKYLNEIIDHFGIESQLNKVAEECEELNLAYHDDLKDRDYDRYKKNLTEELADCTVMCAQLALLIDRIRTKHKTVCKLSWATNCNDCTLCPNQEVKNGIGLNKEAMEYLNEIIDHFGIESQLNKVAEECEELNLAYHDDLKDRDYDRYKKNLAEELADCTVMCAQLALLIDRIRTKHKIDYSEIEKVIEFKINRTLNRIEDEILEQAQEG